MAISLRSLQKVVLPAAGVITAVVLKNGSKQLEKAGRGVSTSMKKLAPLLFVIAWAGVVHAMTFSRGSFVNSKRSKIITMSIVAIVTSVFTLMKGKGKAVKPGWLQYAAIVFGLAWLTLGYGSGLGGGRTGVMIGVGGAVAAIASMLFFLPEQRDLCIVDGPGLPLFTAAFFAIAVANGLSSERV